MRPPFWPEQILRSRPPKPRSNGVDARRKNRRRTIPSCSALSTSSPHSRFIKNGNVSPLEERIGYKFRNSLFLAEALTHPSLGHETQQHHFDNQRLEFLGGGLDTARKFILAQARSDLEQIEEEPVDVNPKGDLQELLQSISPRSPVYELITQSGPEHEKTFVVQAIWEGIVLGQGSGRSKKQAETAAALEAMKLKRWKTLG